MISDSDASRALLLAEGLGACARIAVESEVGERAYIDLAKVIYRKIAGPPRRGPLPMPRGPWDEIVAEAGGQTRLAGLLDVSARTVRRWVSGATMPEPEMVGRIQRMATRLGVVSPFRCEVCHRSGVASEARVWISDETGNSVDGPGPEISGLCSVCSADADD